MSVYAFRKLVLVRCVIQSSVRHECEETMKVNRFGFVCVGVALSVVEFFSTLRRLGSSYLTALFEFV